MDDLERRLRDARPAVPPLPADFSARVMTALEQEPVSIRPAWQVRLGAALRWAAAAALLIPGVLSAGALTLEVRFSGLLEVLYFGADWLGAALRGVPYDLLGLLLGSGLLAAWGVQRLSVLRLPVAWLLLLSYGLAGTGGLAMAGSGLGTQALQASLESDAEWPGLSWYLRERLAYRRPHPDFRMGRVIAVEGERVRLRTPAGEEVLTTVPPGLRPVPGTHLRMVGRQAGTEFRPSRVQQCEPRAVAHYFHHAEMRRRHAEMMGGGMGGGMGRGPGMMGPRRHRGPMGGPMGPRMHRGIPAPTPQAPSDGN